MLDFLGKLSGQVDRGIDTFGLDETLSASLKVAKKRRSMLIILCGDIVENYDEFLKKIAVDLYNLGAINDPQVERRELLPIISRDDTGETIAIKIKEICNREKRILYIKGFHQYEYSVRNTTAFLSRLKMLLNNNQLDAPVIINVPMIVRKVLMDSFPDIWNNSVHYLNKQCHKIDQSLTRTSSSAYVPDFGREMTNARTQGNDNGAFSDSHNRLTSNNCIGDEDRPWYMKNLELLKREKDGMVMLLNDSNSQFEIAALPKTKRLNWRFTLRYNVNGIAYNLDMRIVYSERFSDDNPVIGVVVENLTEKLYRAIKRNLRCMKVSMTDPEFKTVFYIKPVKLKKNDSVAAATLDGFLDLLASLQSYEVI